MNDKREILVKPQIITLGSDLINILSGGKKKIHDEVCLQIISSPSPPLPLPSPPPPSPSQFLRHYMKPESSLSTLSNSSHLIIHYSLFCTLSVL